MTKSRKWGRNYDTALGARSHHAGGNAGPPACSRSPRPALVDGFIVSFGG